LKKDFPLKCRECENLVRGFFNQMERSLEDPVERGALFGEDLRRRGHSVLLDFWTWDREVNADAFVSNARPKIRKAAYSTLGSSQG
jgi:hypothetical protein